MKKVAIIGTGTNGTGSLTADAAKAIASASLLIGAKRMLEPYADSGKTLLCAYQPEIIADAIRNSSEPFAAVLFSGDVSFFSGAKKLLPMLRDAETTVFPGISSMAEMCAKCSISYENMKFVSLHGNDTNIAIHVHMNKNCFFLLGGNLTAAAVCQRLCAYGLSNVQVHIGMSLGYENERILHGSASEFLSIPSETLSIMITENPAYLRSIPSAIPDTEFIREQIPMTKAEIRCNAVSALRIPHGGIVWDIGCGTGSVSVESAFRCPDGQVFAFDQKEAAAALTEQNARRFSCDNITVVTGKAPEILQKYPEPDAVFIGGSCGNLPDIFEVIAQKNPSAPIAMTAVSIETLSQAIPYFERFCADIKITQIAVTRTKKVGSHTMPDPLNPVWLIAGGLKCRES